MAIRNAGSAPLVDRNSLRPIHVPGLHHGSRVAACHDHIDRARLERLRRSARATRRPHRVLLQEPAYILLAHPLAGQGFGARGRNDQHGAAGKLEPRQIRRYVRQFRPFFPAIFLCITVLSVNLLGDGLRDALDPRLAKRL